MKKAILLVSLFLCLALFPSLAYAEFTASDWAQAELAKAQSLSLIPDKLASADLTAAITREEFASVAVKVFACIGGSLPSADVQNPFADTTSPDVITAYGLGIVSGISATEYAPDSLLTREQAATMLCRVLERKLNAAQADYTENIFVVEEPALFADDAYISDWAKDSVYFLSEYGIISGVGDGKFAPRNTTPEEEAAGYANTTREQALLIAARLVEAITSVTPTFKATLDEYNAFVDSLHDFIARLSTAENEEAFLVEYLTLLSQMETQNEKIEALSAQEDLTLGDTMYLYEALVRMIKLLDGFAQ